MSSHTLCDGCNKKLKDDEERYVVTVQHQTMDTGTPTIVSNTQTFDYHLEHLPEEIQAAMEGAEATPHQQSAPQPAQSDAVPVRAEQADESEEPS